MSKQDKDKKTVQPAEPQEPKAETDQIPVEPPDTEALGISRPDENNIDTVDALKAAYPELVEVLLDDQKVKLEEFFANRTAAEIKGHFPELYDRIAAAEGKRAMPDLKTPGFLLAINDPFAAGTLRTFARLAKRSGLQLPFVLPFKDKNSAAAIKGYIVRAEGGGDFERARSAREALKKCK